MRVLLLTLLLLALGLTWWALRMEQEPEYRSDADPAHSIDYFIEDLHYLNFNVQGRITQRLRATHLKHYLASDISQLRQPHFIIYDQDRPIWTISAKTGTLSTDQTQLKLREDAHILRHADATQAEMHIESPSLDIDLKKEYMETSDPVIVSSAQNWIKSIGMKAWLRPPSIIHFLKQTRAYYVVD